METWDAIRARRNVRQFADRPLPPDAIDRILEAGRRTPSSTNWQPWDFIAITERQRLVRLSHVFHGAFHVAGSAATIALIGPVLDDPMRNSWLPYDLGQATIQIMLAAADLGIGSGHAVIADQALAREILHLPDDRFCAYLISLGYPADRPLRPIKQPRRRPFDEVVHREVW